jgi:hypothetical protein
MIATLNQTQTTRPAVEALIDEIGAGRVLLIAARALMRDLTRPRPLTVDDLSDHLRKDVGLGPRHVPPTLRGPVF